jgi:hypothetical protein
MRPKKISDLSQLLDQRKQLGDKSSVGSSPVAEHRFDGVAQFTKGLMVFRDLKHWVVTKSAYAFLLEQDPTVATSFTVDLDFSQRIGQSHMAGVPGGPFFQRHFLMFFEKQLVV